MHSRRELGRSPDHRGSPGPRPSPSLDPSESRADDDVDGVVAAAVEGDVIEDAYQALLSVGHSPMEARNRLDRVLKGGKSFGSVQDILTEIYKQQ